MTIRVMEKSDVERIIEIYQEAFGGEPWFETLSYKTVSDRWRYYMSKRGFECLVVEIDERIVGATWFDTPTPQELADERGEVLTLFLKAISGIIRYVWVRDTIVAPDFQGRGMATSLKNAALKKILEKFPKVFILTRMRDDNIGIIRINEKLGFSRTGVRVPSSQKAGIFHEYWYLAP